MSLKANISIVLHIHSFKNIALPHKARYALRALIYSGGQTQNYAMPFNTIETESKPKKNVSKDNQFQDNYFQTKRFNIEYQQQDIPLNDCCQFKFTIEGFPELKDQDIYLEFILMENGHCYFRESIHSAVEMKEVERYRFKLEDLKAGIFRYCQGEFNQKYISSFSFTLFAMITDYRFHPYLRNPKKQSPKEKAREKINNIAGMIEWSQKYLKNCDNGGLHLYRNFVKNLRYNSSTLRGEATSFFRKGGEVKLRAPIGQGGALVVVSQKQFFEYMTSFSPAEQITQERLIAQIHEINVQNFEFVEEIKQRISKRGIQMKALKEQYRTQRKDLFGHRVFRSIVYGKQPRDKQTNVKIAHKMRKKAPMQETKIMDQYLFTDKKNQHYAFLEVNLPESLKVKQPQSALMDNILKQVSQIKQVELKNDVIYDQRNMLVVLVHGFQASSFDMQIIKRQINKMLPVAMFLVSSANELDTDGDISIMGFRLAQQVKSQIVKHFEEEQVILNFVGHSMGGIIARAALPHLERFKKQMGFFFSLSSPHIGYLNGVDVKIKTGLWFMRKMNKLKSLDQLSLQDNQKLRKTFLYKLSQDGHLRHFKKVILVSSSEDSYVAWHSARLEYYQSSNNSSKVEKQMIDSILGQQIVHRIDVLFDISSTQDMDSFIGRAAHINMLTHECVFKLIHEAIPSLFDIKTV